MDFGFRSSEVGLGEPTNPQSEIRNPKLVYLILGLGNPGPEYEDTFHNAGFRVLERMAGELQIRLKERFAGARISDRVVLGGQKAVLVLPQTFMNRSGTVLPPLLERFETTIQNTVVVCDDLALPLGKLRVRQKGSAGGHNGLKSIISTVGSDEFMRVRIGIQPDREIGEVRDFVLSRVGKADREVLDRAEEVAARAVESLLADGIEKTMAAFNGIDLRQSL
jgi:peptidyl-tRNA hydrolase, PTH1 family